MSTKLRQMFSRFRHSARQREADSELNGEIHTHLEMLVDRFVQQGMSREEAVYAARKQFGNRTLLEERHREARSFQIVSTLIKDVRYGFRMLVKSPGFTTTAVLTLALGIGANTAIFTLVNAVTLSKLPVANPESLVWLGNRNDCCVGSGIPDGGGYSLFSTDAYEVLRKNTKEFEDLAAIQAGFEYRPVVVRRQGTQEAARSVMGEFVSGNYFRTFGLNPRVGRLFSDGDDLTGAATVAVMSYRTWVDDYGSDPSVVGSTFFINTKPVTIAGIAPEGFYGDRISNSPPNFYLPIESMTALANVPYVQDRNTNWLYIVGRLKPGAQKAQVEVKISAVLRQELAGTASYASAANRAKLSQAHIVLTPGGGGIQAMQEGYKSQLRLLMCVSGMLLLIACANIANLQLVRGTARKSEISIRAALGAGRGRIAGQLLTESLLLAGLSGIAALVIAYLGTRMLLLLAFPGSSNVPVDASPSAAVLAFACGLSLVAAVLFGMAPAWIASQTEPVEALRSGKRSTAGASSWLQRGLVTTQAALSLVLLIGAGLFSESLRKLETTDLKLESTNRYIVHFNPQAAGYSGSQVGPLYRRIEQQFRAIPGVEKVGISNYTPMEDNNNGYRFEAQGRPERSTGASVIRANAQYFDSVGTHVLVGRGISLKDTPESPNVAVVNKSFVKKLFEPGESPLGRHVGPDPKSASDYEIVGVVEDTAYTSARWKDHAMLFVPLLQRPASDKSPIDTDESLYAGAIVLKVNQPRHDMESIARKTLSSINPNLSVVKFQTFDAQIAGTFTQERMLARLTQLFGVLALLLATLGLYGVMAYTVARRTGEIGIRMALGAARKSVIVMVVRGAVTYAFWGLALGIPAALACVGLVKAQLYEVTGIDMSVLCGSIVILGLAALVAGLIPARRAASIDPARALRME